jgi:hypothetical protein
MNENDIAIVKNLRSFIQEYNQRYFKKVTETLKKEYWLPVIGFEIKDREKLPGIESNVDVSGGEPYDGAYSSKKEIIEMGAMKHDALFSVAYLLEHKKFLWRVNQPFTENLYIHEEEELRTGTVFNEPKIKEKNFNNLTEVANYLTSKIVEIYEKFSPK